MIENKRPAIRVMMKSPVKKSISNLGFGCCSKPKLEMKLIALRKGHRNIADASTNHRLLQTLYPI